MKKQRTHHSEGVSLIALVITIIVVIILAAIAFGTSTRTITNANYSDYVNNVGEVYTAFHTRAVTIKGQEAAKGNNVTDAQVYHYLADNSGEFEVRANLPSYTVIKDEEQIGMALPKMRIENAAGKMVDVQYAVTSEGEIFTWPPFDYEDSLKINDKDTATAKDAETITVGDMTFTVNLDEDKLLAVGTAGGSSTSSGSSTTATITYPSGKTKDTVAVGETVTITSGETSEDFYVVRRETNGTLKLLSALRVNPNTLEQDSNESNTTTVFSSSPADNYWSSYYSTKPDLTDDDNITSDKNALYYAKLYGEKFGLEGTLLTKEDLETIYGALRNGSSLSSNTWIATGQNFWLGSAYTPNVIWYVYDSGTLNYSSYGNTHGLRPVLKIS